MSATPAPDPVPDFSEDNLVGRSGYGTSRYWRYSYGGYDFMAVAYLARWAGPVAESRRPLRRLPTSRRPACPRRSTCRAPP